jgi:hypothetical protein
MVKVNEIRRLELKVRVSVKGVGLRNGVRWEGDAPGGHRSAACAGRTRSSDMRLCGCCLG